MASIHNNVLDKIREKRKSNLIFNNIETNPGSKRNFKVGGKYPDVVFLGPLAGAIILIGEVEVPDNPKDKTQWKKYSNLGHDFYVWVAEPEKNKTEAALKEKNIKATVLTYSLSNDGKVLDVEMP